MPTPDEVPTLDLEGEPAARRVGWGFISLYALAFTSTSLLFLAPLLVSLALKVNSLVGIEQAPNSLSVVTGIGALVAVLPDQVPVTQRGLVAGVLGVCVPVASVSGTFLVKLFTGSQLAMFLAPCAVGGLFILLFAVTLDDRRLARADKPAWSLREFAGTFYVNPRRSPDFAWAFASRFMFVLAYAFLTTYQAYYLLDRIGSAEADVPRQIFLGTLAQSVVVVAASLIGGRLSDRTGRRKIFVLTAAVVYGLAMFVIAIASDFNGFLVGMAVGGLGFGVYTAVDLALVADVLPDSDNAAKDLGVLNIAGALPFSVAPGIAPAVLAIGGGSYGVLYAVAGVCAIIGAAAILPVKGVR
jgi:Major Facilitator Superfamily